MVALAAIVAWYNLRIDVARTTPWLFGTSLVLCVAAVFGVRECVRVLKGQPVRSSKFATVIFWLGIAYVLFLGAVMAWAVIWK